MNSKVMFWVNDDLSTLGLIDIIQKKYDFDVYSILDITDKTKKFFLEQRIIKFSKIWYLHDHILKNSKKADLDYLKLVEKKYDIDLKLMASNERFFNKFNQFYNFSVDEINSIIEQECKLFERVLDEIKPDFLVIGITTLHHNHLFYKICKARGINIRMIRPSSLAGKYIVGDSEISFMNENVKKRYNFKTFSEIQKFLKEYDSSKRAKKVIEVFQSSRMNFFKAMVVYMFSGNSNIRTHYSYYGRKKLSVVKQMFSYEMNKWFRKSFMKKNLIQKLDHNESYVYYPLHVEPERSVNIAAPKFSNQIEVIEKISSSLPAGCKLYVKEHPVMHVRGWRETKIYKKIMSIPNVRLFHPAFSSELLLKNSSLVIQIGGTSVLEAAFYNKPSIIFTDLDYLLISSIHKISSYDELSSKIEYLMGKEVKISDLNDYIDLVDANSFEVDLIGLSQKFADIFRYNGFLMDTEIPIDKMENYLKEYQEEFSKYAKEIVNRMSS